MSITRLTMRNAGYSEAEILEILGPEKPKAGLTPEQVEAINMKTSLYLKECQEKKPMTVADLPRKPITEVLGYRSGIEKFAGSIESEYAEKGYRWEAAKVTVAAIAAVGYSDVTLCGQIESLIKHSIPSEKEREEYSFDPAKGLLISGGIGIGKTTAFLMCKKHEALYASIVSCLELKKAVAKGGYAEVEKYERIKNVVFDDLGREGNTANSYGNRIEAVADIIAARYENWIAGKVNKTYFTTNISLEQLADLYSPHIVNRIKQMCNFLILPQEQKSFR